MRASGTPSRHEVETICVSAADALVKKAALTIVISQRGFTGISRAAPK